MFLLSCELKIGAVHGMKGIEFQVEDFKHREFMTCRASPILPEVNPSYDEPGFTGLMLWIFLRYDVRFLKNQWLGNWSEFQSV